MRVCEWKIVTENSFHRSNNSLLEFMAKPSSSNKYDDKSRVIVNILRTYLAEERDKEKNITKNYHTQPASRHERVFYETFIP